MGSGVGCAPFRRFIPGPGSDCYLNGCGRQRKRSRNFRGKRSVAIPVPAHPQQYSRSIARRSSLSRRCDVPGVSIGVLKMQNVFPGEAREPEPAIEEIVYVPVCARACSP